MSPRRRFLLLPALVLGSLAAVAFAAQEPEEGWAPLGEFGEQISVDLVNVEVWVTDRQGRPVTGLTREDFEVFENGARMEITNFSAFDETRLRSGIGDPAAAAPPSPDEETAEEPAAAPVEVLAAEPAPVVDPARRLHLVVFLDNWNLQPNGRELVFDDLERFLTGRVRPEDRVMVAVHGRSLEVVQEFTSDPARLERALERAESAAPARIQLRNEWRSAQRSIRDFYQQWAEFAGMMGEGDICGLAMGDMQNAARGYAAAVQAHVQRSAGALASVSEYLSGVPGRKVLVYVGGGLSQQPGNEMFQYLAEVCPHHQSQIQTNVSLYDLTPLFEEVARRANAAGITLYTIEAEVPEAIDDISVAGLRGRMSDAGANDETSGDGASGSEGEGGFERVAPGGGGGLRGERPATHGVDFQPSASVRRTEELTEEDSLAYMARETGGRAILNANDFEDEFDRLATELRTYYSLGFTPDHQGDGRLHRLEVKLKEKGYRVRHRLAYHDKPYELRMAERIRGVAQFGTGSNSLELRVETGEATTSPAGGARVPLRIWVPLDRLALVPQNGQRRGSLRVMMAVSDAAGNLGPVRQKMVPVEVGSGEGEVGAREHLVEVELDLQGDDHVVALAVRDEVGGDASYLRHEVRLGASPQARLEP